MRRSLILLSLLLILLAACAPAVPAGSGEVEDTPTAQEAPVDETARQPVDQEPNTGDRFVFDSGPGEPIDPAEAPKPELIWNNDPENVVLSVTFCCGFSPQLAVTNYIPDATIFGDGRFIWSITSDTGSREVYIAQLSPESMEKLLAQISETGFFGWQDRYQDPTVADAADQCILVNLEGVKKSVCEYVKGAPATFHELYDFLAAGAGQTGTEYVPEAAYLTTESMGRNLDVGDQRVSTLDDATLDLNLEEIQGGAWIEGPALAQLWQAVNAQPWLPLVQDEQAFFLIGLQIPGLSLVAPPAQ